MSVSAKYSSSVYANDDHVFETLTIQMEDKNSPGYLPAVIVSRRAERQCFQYTDYEDAESRYDNEYVLNREDWEILDIQVYDHIGQNNLIGKINEITTELVQKYNVRDVKRAADWVSLYRQEFLVAFAEKKTYPTLLNHKEMERFERDIKITTVEDKAQEIIGHFRKHFSLPVRPSLHSETPKGPTVEKPKYEAWGDWA